MTEIEKLSEELAEYNVPDELIGRIENLLANLYAEKERLRIERNWEISPDRMGKWGGVMKVKTFLSTYHGDIDLEVNDFLSKNSVKFIDIKYNSTITTDGYNNVIQQYSALVVYEEV